ncbi:MarR family transcriptional regulator [Ponticaulis sp.]|uniref:MarR family winged helix-turn-helix transcriptional regulator n=1 Tax=Ponticaulis sp. TaxID=2020902 RepID=UPI000B6ABE52|nr:MarR family transcriptional regulator [Ponticaulis sp.]MAI91588.1 MarR family transcriptional regulator [Ponticaulis sp.]OUX97542.1 MAG: hypothetical protein CBB65_14200 [Hyphomonadaceae bacterium TMED5]|tara:strand:+ start:55582 stop:56058 length:477 start_codon:yes stop_codon:yes gene_type:complete
MSDRSDEALILIRQIQRQIEISARKFAETEGLTPSQLKVLQLLTEYPEISVGWISEQTQLKNATITSLVDKLVDRGMVSRRRCDSDRRRVWIKMEQPGWAALSSAPQPLQRKFTDKFDDLPEWQKTMLISSLQMLSEMLGAEGMEAASVLDVSSLSSK